jgi:catechol 2,3-dioxygenase
VGLRYYTIVLPNKEVLETMLTNLRDAEITVEDLDEGWFVQDPSKNGILLVSR